MTAVLLGQNTEQPQEGAATYTSTTEEVESDHTHVAAFMVLIDKEGNYVFEPDINKPVVTKRSPTPSEIKGALATLLGDIRTQEGAILAANATIQGQMQMARQMQEQAMNQQVLQQMGRSPR
jgi:hypothetical protein